MWLVLFAFIGAVLNVSGELLPPCSSLVYCYGPLLHTVQLSRIFNDSKTFVDMKMRSDYTTTLTNFEIFMVKTNRTPSREEVKGFVEDNFEAGNELEKWQPPDYNVNVKFVNNISDPVVRDFARHLVELWPILGRKVKPEVTNHTDKYSLVPVPNGFIIPGGRFREFYYWDSYWMITGLLISEMGETARGMIDNFIHIVKNYGFIPNGGRIYYLNRSQPPLLTKMALKYYEYSKDQQWLKENIEYLNKELLFWLANKTVKVKKNGKSYTMAHYSVKNTGPRPESYIEDYKMATFHPDSKDELYSELKSGAESGWDFSSRWIVDQNGGNLGNLSQIQTKRIIPVDLNAYLCEAFQSISYLYSELGDYNNTMYWRKMGMYWKQSIEEVMWDNEDGIWYDFDQKLSKPRKYFYASNFAPLWTGCFDKHEGENLGMRALNYLVQSGALETPGGIGISQIETGEQWDFPNAWPPLQALIVQALERSGAPNAIAAAKNIALKWIEANIKGFRDTGEMFEKYNAVHPGKYGGGGEYVVQSGFGWTNGVALEFIHKYFYNNDARNEIFS